MPDLSQLSDEEILRNLPDEIILQKMGKQTNKPKSFLDKAGDIISLPIPFGPPIKDVPAIASRGLDMAGFGIPGALFKKATGNKLPEAETVRGKAYTAAAEGAGFMLGGPEKLVAEGIGRLSARIAPKFLSKGIGKAAIRSAASVGSTGVTEGPGEVFKRAAIGGTLGAAGEAIAPPLSKATKGIGDIASGLKTLFSNKEKVALAQATRATADQVSKGAGPAFEASMRQLPGKVDISKEIGSLSKLTEARPTLYGAKGQVVSAPSELNASLKAALQEAMDNAAKVGDTTLQTLLENPAAASQLTPLEAHQAVTTLRQLPTIIRQYAQNPATRQTGGQMLQRMGEYDTFFKQLADQIQSRITQAHPKTYPSILAQYGKTQKELALLTPQLSPRSDRLVKNIERGSLAEGEIGEAAESFLPEPVKSRIFQAAKAKKTLDNLDPRTWIFRRRR